LPYITRPRDLFHIFPLGDVMFWNYLTVAVRNLQRQKLYTVINIFGLALGIACCLLIALFVKYEWSYDRFHEHKDLIYRIVAREVNTDGKVKFSSLHPLSIVEPLVEALPGIKRATGFIHSFARISGGEHTFREKFGEVNADFLQMFSFPLLAGDSKTALVQPNGVVISESLVHKFFGTLDSGYETVLGQALTFHSREDQTFVITGVMQDIPKNSSLQFDLLIPIENYKKYGKYYETGGFTVVYVQIAEEQNVTSLETALTPVVEANQAERIRVFKETGRIRDKEDGYQIHLQPLKDVYWNPLSSSSYEEKGNPFTAYLLSSIAALVLLIACSNFMTLSVGRSTSRAVEVGVRKVMGAHRWELMQQFWGEAILLSFFALGLGLALAELFLPVFNGLIEKELNIAYFYDGSMMPIIVGIVVAVGLVAGGYPAVVLSRFQVIDSLKGQTHIGGRSNMTRTLVVLQYSASVVLLICTGVIVEQQHYMSHKDLGFDKEQVIVVQISGMGADENQIAERYKQAVLTYSQVIVATVADRNLTNDRVVLGYRPPGGSEIRLWHIRIDPEYVQTMDLTILGGRNFNANRPTDQSGGVLVNEALVKAIGLHDPIGKTLKGYNISALKEPTIIGVVQDFHVASLREEIPPLLLHMKKFWGNPKIMIRVRTDDISGTLALLKDTWEIVAPHRQFRHTFLNEDLERMYRNEQRWQDILTYSALFATFISCLGLLGLASLAVERRKKEIGIRKVLGASVPNLVNLLSIDFAKLLLAANIIAWPVAYLAMGEWLSDFAYRIDLGIGIFALTGALTLGIAMLTVCAQTLKSAQANPVDALRNE